MGEMTWVWRGRVPDVTCLLRRGAIQWRCVTLLDPAPSEPSKSVASKSDALVAVHSVCISLQRRPHGPDDPPLKHECGACVRVGVRVRKAGLAEIDGSATGWL